MKLNRRDCLRAGALAGAGALVSGCNKIVYEATAPKLAKSIALPAGAIAPIVRLVNRLSFGPNSRRDRKGCGARACRLRKRAAERRRRG